MTDKLQLVSILDQSLNTKVLQGSVATCLRCDGIFSDHFVTQSPLGSGYDGGKILKIGQHLPKLWARIKCPVFWLFCLSQSTTKSTAGRSPTYQSHYHKLCSRQNPNQADIGTLTVAYLSPFVVCLFVYLFIYLLSNAAQGESLSPSGPKI